MNAASGRPSHPDQQYTPSPDNTNVERNSRLYQDDVAGRGQQRQALQHLWCQVFRCDRQRLGREDVAVQHWWSALKSPRSAASELSDVRAESSS